MERTMNCLERLLKLYVKMIVIAMYWTSVDHLDIFIYLFCRSAVCGIWTFFALLFHSVFRVFVCLDLMWSGIVTRKHLLVCQLSAEVITLKKCLEIGVLTVLLGNIPV